ncbi:MAG: hypothetical protein WHF31_15165 [Candidatus Dehalobacter alkaniphilus]
MNKTNVGLVEFAKSKLNLPTIYMLSGFGRRLTEAMIQKRIASGCTHTIKYKSIIRAGIGKYVYDCGGLIKGYLWETSPGVVGYNNPVGSDQNAKMMYKGAKVKGPIATMPDIKGLLVMTADLGHVGIYIGRDSAGNRQYIEASPAFSKWKVFQSNDTLRQWTYWAKYQWIDYIEEPVVQVVEKIVYVDKIVEVENPINAIFNDGRIEVTVKSIASK